MQTKVIKILSLVLCVMMLATVFAVVALVKPNDGTQDEAQDEACRFWGIIGDPAPEDVIENHLLGDPPNYTLWPNCLKRLGGSCVCPSGNCDNYDGWGVGYYSGAGTSTVLRGVDPAWEDLGFDWAVGNTIAAGPDIAVGHVRSSTNVEQIANPHPFERYRMGRWWLFGHNGGVTKSTLRNLITEGQPPWTYFQAHPEDIPYCYCRIGECEHPSSCNCPGYPSDPDMCLYNDTCGIVDSELYFIYLLKCIEQQTATNWSEKVWNGTRQAVDTLNEFSINYRLNFFLTDGDTLWAFRKGVISQPQDYTLYYYNCSPSYCAIASQYPTLNQGSWASMNQWDMAILRQGQGPEVRNIYDDCPVTFPTPPTQPVWPEYTGYKAMTAPVLADFDPYYPGIEIISAADSGKEIFVWHQDGTSMNKYSPKILAAEVSPKSAPALGDLDGDGLLDLVIATKTSVVKIVYAFNARDDELWNQTVGRGVTSAPVLADLNNDSALEVLVSSKDGRLYIWNADGTVFDPGGNPWPKQTNETLYWSPAVGNLDEDSDLEIVVGGGGERPPFHVFVWNIDGSDLNAHWPKEIPDDYWACTPSLADIDQDECLEIVMGVGHDEGHGRVYAWETSTGSTVTPNWPKNTTGYPFWCPISDLDPECPELEIVTSVDHDNEIHAWHYDGTNVSGWPYIMGEEGGHSPAIGDIDGDGGLEVVVGSNDSWVYAIRSNGSNVSGWPKETGGPIKLCSSPAIGDIDNDEIAEVVQPSSDKYVYLWEVDPANNAVLQWTWPMLQHDERHSGLYI